MALTPRQLEDKWTTQEFIAANYDQLDDSYLRRFTTDLVATFGALGNLSEPITLVGAQQLARNSPSDPRVVANVLYGIESGAWNGGKDSATVHVHGVNPGSYAPIGYTFLKGVGTLVRVDVAAGTFEPFVSAPAPVSAQLLGLDPATRELLVLLSPGASTTLASYVLAEYAAGSTPTAPLPASASIASRILRLPASVFGTTLCLLDAAGLPVPLAELTHKADEDGRFDQLTPLDPAVPQSSIRGSINWRYEVAPATGEWYLKPGRSVMFTVGSALRFPPDVQEGDIFGVYINPTSATTRIVLTCAGGIDEQLTRRYTKGTSLVFRYTLFPASTDANGNPVAAYYGLRTLQQTTPTALNSRGVFASGTYYLPGDVATFQGALYLRQVEGSDTTPAPDPAKWVGGPSTPAPVLAVVAGVEKGYATLADAFAANPSAIHLHADLQVATVIGGRFDGKLFGNGHTVTITSAGELKLSRYASLYQLSVGGAGSLSITGSGASAGATVPPADECVQLVDCALDVALKLDAVGAYQGLALRGTTVASNLAAGGGPVYLYDLAEAAQPLPAGFTLIDRRPGAAGGGGPTYAAGTGITISATNVISTNAERVYFSKWTNTTGQFLSSLTTNSADGYQYYFVALPQKVSEILPAGAAGYDPATGIFTAPAHGLYDVNYYLAVVGLAAGDDYTALICGPNSTRPAIAQQWFAVGTGSFNEGRLVEKIELQAGQQIKLGIGATHAQAGQPFQFVASAAVSLYKFL